MTSLAVAASEPQRVAIPPRAERVRALRAIMGPRDLRVRPLPAAIRATAYRHFDRYVVPLVERAWPALVRDRFYAKLRFGACDLYASAPYTALFCAPRRPLVVRAVTDTAARLPLPSAAIGLLGRGAMEIVGRFAFPCEHRRIILVAAFIVVVDHVFDHCLDGPPEERARAVKAAMDGAPSPGSPPLALLAALARAMGERLGDDERAAFEAALARVSEWIDAEVAAMRGEPDPRGLGHRLAGVEGTIDGLLFPVVRYAGEGARAWMYGVSLFVQMMDDWLDCEKDAEDGRSTPVLDGRWTLTDVRAGWEGTLEGLDDLVRGAGLGTPRYLAFVRACYVLMMHDVMEAMITGLAD